MTELMYLVGFFILVVLVLIAITLKQNQRITSLLHGKNAKSLEDTLLHFINEIKRIQNEHRNIELVLKDMNTRLKTSITGVGLIRFNPFAHSGGNQSFAIALIDEHGDGIIISTLYGRERTSIFAKPIEKYSSSYELTEEERQALAEARKK